MRKAFAGAREVHTKAGRYTNAFLSGTGREYVVAATACRSENFRTLVFTLLTSHRNGPSARLIK